MKNFEALLLVMGIVFLQSFAIGSEGSDRLKVLSDALGKQVEVVTAEPAASIQKTNNGVSIGAGATLTFRVQFTCSAVARFKITGTGKPTVTCDPIREVKSANGVYSFIGKKDTTYSVTVTAADDAITVSNVKVPQKGLLIRVD